MVTFCGCHVLGGTPDVDIVSENYEKKNNNAGLRFENQLGINVQIKTKIDRNRGVVHF